MRPTDEEIKETLDSLDYPDDPLNFEDALAIAKWARDQMIPQWFKRDLDPHELYEPFDLIVVAHRGSRAPSVVTVREYRQCKHVAAWRAFIPGIDNPPDWPLEGEGDG